MNALTALKEYAAMEQSIAVLEERQAYLAREIRQQVEEVTGAPVEGYGLRARMKPGRKTTNHEMAAREGGAEPAIIEKHTVHPAPRTSWAKVTKEMEIDTSEYVTQAPPRFIIERV